jgi:Domain of unknown function (DUF6457)
MTAREWIDSFAAELGAEPPGEDELHAVLDLAAVAAHASERIAAPMACWIGGASGRSLGELREIAGRIAPSGQEG